MKIIVIPGLTLPDVGAADLARIRRAAGAESTVLLCDLEMAMEEVADADVIFGPAPPALFAKAQRLRWVQAIASGVDGYLYPDFVDSDVLLTSEKGLVGEHLADHAFGLLLMLTRQLATAHRLGPDSWAHRVEMRRQEVELTGMTMGIFGLGGTGRATARRAAAFGMRCIAVDRDQVPPAREVEDVLPLDRIEEFLGAADVIAVCCPLTGETRSFFDAATFARMRRGAWLVNVTRGEVLVEADLVAALKSGQLAGAALDVAPREPLPPESELWSLPNVVMTPHTAGASQFRAGRNLDRFVRNVERFAGGKPLEGLIDKRAGY
ncbi:MAG TPA: D-2-hydroxyacid dehydrogenase [Pseudomonadales bacterium]